MTALTKVFAGAYATRQDGVDRHGQRRAGCALIARGAFSIVVVRLVASPADGGLGALVAAYVMRLATAGPIIARLVDSPRPQ